jgi:hypothetical protein
VCAQGSGILDFRSHDLRRTTATNITKLGYSRFIMDRVLGQLELGVGGRYDRNDYLREKRTALNPWARYLEKIVLKQSAEASNILVMPLQRSLDVCWAIGGVVNPVPTVTYQRGRVTPPPPASRASVIPTLGAGQKVGFDQRP